MAKQATTLWRESASVIILTRAKISEWTSDFKILLLRRSENATFMPRSSVFPGGVIEPNDASSQWLQYFQNFGLPKQRLMDLTRFRSRQTRYTESGEDLEKEISLRITAIRETFEEVGILLCRNKQNICDPNPFGRFKEDFDRVHWQHVIHNDAAQFLVLCKDLEVVPDLWRLHEWSAWLSPSTIKKRFETSFYIVALEETPNVIIEKNEAMDCSWKTSLEYLKSFLNNEISLAPPQFYELSRLQNFSELDKLIQFAKERAEYGTTLFLPVQYKCTDGIVSLLPGDDLYPEDPSNIVELKKTGITTEEFRANVNKLHRAEYLNNSDTFLHLNLKPLDGHLAPVSVSCRL